MSLEINYEQEVGKGVHFHPKIKLLSVKNS